jgi:hypothetical protein
VARPKIYTPDDIAKKLKEYCDTNDNPIIKKFCIQDGNPCHDHLLVLAKECKALSETIKRCISKQEVWYEEQVSKGNVPPAWAIFKMKQPQHGWTDKQEIVADVNSTVTINVTVEGQEE